MDDQRTVARVYCGAVQDAITDGSTLLAHAALHNLITLLKIQHTSPTPNTSTLSTEELQTLAHLQQASVNLQQLQTPQSIIWTHHFTTLADVLLTGM